MPLGMGYHTPIRVPFTDDGNKDDYKLRLSVGKHWELNERGLPTGNLLNLSDEELKLRNEGLIPTGIGFEFAMTDEAIQDEGKPYHGAIITDKNKNCLSLSVK
jgi:aldose 1-epimerase